MNWWVGFTVYFVLLAATLLFFAGASRENARADKLGDSLPQQRECDERRAA